MNAAKAKANDVLSRFQMRRILLTLPAVPHIRYCDGCGDVFENVRADLYTFTTKKKGYLRKERRYASLCRLCRMDQRKDRPSLITMDLSAKPDEFAIHETYFSPRERQDMRIQTVPASARLA